MNDIDQLMAFDSEVGAAVGKELERQRHNIELIASENIVSKAVLLAAGTVNMRKVIPEGGITAAANTSI